MKAKAKAIAIPSTKRLPGTGGNTHNPVYNPGRAAFLAARQREKKACELRLDGLTYAQIAAKMGITSMGAYKLIMRVLARELDDIRMKVPDLRKLELLRCDKMLKAIATKVSRGDLKAITVALKIAERRAKLVGLDAPVNVQLSGQVNAVSVETFRLMLDDSRVETDAVAEIEAGVKTIECEVIASDIAIPEGRKPI
jgi:hypothetical protein